MTREKNLTNVIMIALALIGVVTLGQKLVARYLSGPSSASGYAKTFGSPSATLFHEDYAGPPVIGDNITHTPALASLRSGQQTYEVRMDIVPAELEVAPGVRYSAWTFGGSVPGPSSTFGRETALCLQ